MSRRGRSPRNTRTTAVRADGPRRPDGRPNPLDDVDRQILGSLRDDARVSISQLAADLHLSRASTYVRLGRLQERGIITGFTLRVDSQQLGLGIGALITIEVNQARWRSVQNELASMPEVEWCAAMAGDFDVVILVRAPDIETMRDVVLERLNNLEGIERTKTLFILEEAIPHRVVLP